MGWNFRAGRSDFERGYWLMGWKNLPDGAIDFIKGPLEVKRYEDEGEEVNEEPFVKGISWDFLQALSDALWTFGVRPTDFDDHTLEIEAIRDHLADMRAIVAKRLDLELP